MELKILVVDDDSVYLMIHAALIKKSKLGEPLTFLKAKELVDYLIKNRNSGMSYLVFLDINMPEMDAWEFLNLTKEYNDHYYVIIVTSSINQADKEKARSYPNIITFIEKPMKIEDCNKIKILPEFSPFFKNEVS